MTSACARLIGLALAAWFLCFAVLARFSTWLPFALAGPVIAAGAFRTRAVPVALLRPSLRCVSAGLIGGALMVAFTHVAFASLAAAVPSVLPATRELFGLLDVTGFSGAQRAALIVVIASCEEVLFRGPLLCSALRDDERQPWRPTRRQLARVFTFAAAYALTTAPLASPLLILCAFLCGSVWGVMGTVGGSLTVPILSHVVWDLGVLVVWPLCARL